MTNIQNKWKYFTFGLLAVLAVGFSFPQAIADVTNNVQHMIQHVYEDTQAIKAKTDNFPSDPASNTIVNTRASQESVDSLAPQAVRYSGLEIDPEDGGFEFVTLAEASPGNLLSGRITLFVTETTPSDNEVLVFCENEGLVITGLGSDGVTGLALAINEEFVCDKVRISVSDPASDEAPAVILWGAIEYVEVNNVTTLP